MNIIKGWINYYLDLLGLIPEPKRSIFDTRLLQCQSNVCGKLKFGICTACGCPVKKKTKVLLETCPENMWNPTVYEFGDIQFIFREEIPVKAREQFEEWLIHQTLPMVDGLPESDIAFVSDWYEFLEQLK